MNQSFDSEHDKPEASPEVVEPSRAHESVAEEDSAQQRIAELTAQLEEERIRAAAAEQNLRRRHQEEIQAAHKFAAQKFATEVLAVRDYLEMALLDQSGNFDALKMGVDMTLAELKKAFEKEGITEITAVAGDKLDPHQHQPMQQVESNEPSGHVVQLLKKGYRLNDRVLRPAMVSVAK